MLDTTRTYETPESIELSLNVAGVIPRASAWLIDFLIRLAIWFGCFLVLSMLGDFGMGIFWIIFFVIMWFYPVFFEIRSGATPGKKKYNLMVCHDNGTPISWQSSVTRNLLRVADFAPVMFGFGIISMLFHKDFKRLGDIAAGTIVIHTESANVYDIPEAAPIALPAPITWAQQQAILSFAERVSTFSPERQQELAVMLDPYFQSAHRNAAISAGVGYRDIGDPVQKIIGYANYIVHGLQQESQVKATVSGLTGAQSPEGMQAPVHTFTYDNDDAVEFRK